MKKLVANGVVIVCMILAACLTVWPQAADTGQITGSVTDPTGAVIVGAKVTLTDKATNTSHSTESNGSGVFTFANVVPGTYDLTASKSGFRDYRFSGARVLVGQLMTVNVQMKLGAAVQEVTVTSTPGAELQTSNSTMGTVISGDALISLPNQNRDATSLLIFQPNTAPTFGGAEGNTTGGQVAGAMSDQNTYTLDGGNATDDLAGDNNYTAYNRGYVAPQAAIPTPIESIQEFKVNTNNMTADFSDADGAQVLLITKRGTDQWHGSLYDYFQADWLNANSWNNNVVGVPKVKEHQNRVGGSVGGRALPGETLGGRTYFYFNYEGRRYPYANGRFEKLTPSALLRQGIIQYRDTEGSVNQINLAAATGCGADGTLPCDPRGLGISPLIQNVWNRYMPDPNDLTKSTFVNGDNLNTQGYFASLKLPITDDFAVARIDHDFGSNWRFNGTYRYYKLVYPSTDQVDIGGLLAGDTKGALASHSSNPQQPRYVSASLTGTISPTMTNHFTLSYLRNDWNWKRVGVPICGVTIQCAADSPLNGIPGGLEIGGEAFRPLAPMNMNTQQARFRTWNGHDWGYTDTLSWLKGKHFVQFGGNIKHWWDNHVRPDNVTGALTQLVYQINKGSGLRMTSAFQPPHCPDLPTPPTPGCIDTNNLGGANGWNNLYSEVLGFVGTASKIFVRGGSDFHLTGASYLQDHSITDAYSLFVSDSFKIKPNLTLNFGLEWGVQMPPYEQDGIQDYLTDDAGNPISYQSYIDNQQRAALNGQVYNPITGFEPIRAVGGHPKYPFQPFYGGFSPRISAAWSPAFSGGFLGKVFGTKRSVIRGGYARIYDRNNAVDMVLTPLLGYGFGQPIRCRGAGLDGLCHGQNGTTPNGNTTADADGRFGAFRIGVDDNTAPFPAASETLPIPAEPGINTPAANILFGLDSKWRPGSNDQIDFGIQRELPGNMLVEVGYVGRWAKHLYLGMDQNNVPYMLTLGGQTFANAYLNLSKAESAGIAAANQPFFETALAGSGYCAGFTSCTAAVQANEGAGAGGTSNINLQAVYPMFADIDGLGTDALGNPLGWNFPGCVGCSILGESLQGYAGLDVSTTKGFANYQGGFVTLQKRTGHGLTLSSNVTWSHSLNTIGINQEYVEASPSNVFNLHSDYAPAPWDRRWVVNILSSYELPFGRGKRFGTSNGIVDRVIGGWQIAPLFTWATGTPIETYTGSCQEFGQGNTPWCSGAVPLVNTGTFGHSGRLNVDTQSCGSQPNCGSVGVNNDPAFGGTGGNLFKDPTAVYNSYRPVLLGLDNSANDLGPYYGQNRWNLDFTIAKNTRITERVQTSFYAAFANGLNHMMYGDPSMNLQGKGDWGALYGQYGNPRNVELGLRISF